jgi:galactokinase
MTGQGFGGCTYTFLREDVVEDYKKRLEDYERIFGFHPVIYEMRLSGGCRLVSGPGREEKI